MKHDSHSISGIVLNPDVNVLSFGNFMLARGVDGIDEDIAKKLDDALSMLSPSAMRVLGVQMNTSHAMIYDVLNFNKRTKIVIL